MALCAWAKCHCGRPGTTEGAFLPEQRGVQEAARQDSSQGHAPRDLLQIGPPLHFTTTNGAIVSGRPSQTHSGVLHGSRNLVFLSTSPGALGLKVFSGNDLVSACLRNSRAGFLHVHWFCLLLFSVTRACVSWVSICAILTPHSIGFIKRYKVGI